MDILVTIISILGALIVIGIIIMTHELGHYSIGRACKLKIDEFAVGFGPKIKSWVKNDIKYSIRWFFVGGYTRFHGEDEDSHDKLAFNNQPAGRRALSIAAGPVFNFIFAFFLVIFTLCFFGDYVPTIGQVWQGSPAQAAGLQPGDRIVEMNGVKLDFYMETSDLPPSPDYLNVTVLRDGQEKSFIVEKVPGLKEYDRNGNPVLDKDGNAVVHNEKMAGITFGAKPVTYGFFEAIALSFKWMFFIVKSTLAAILGLFAGQGTQNAAGLVGMVDYLGFAIRNSLQSVLQLGVAISVSLAIMNLLPLPALDGGRLVFIAIEKIFRKPVPRNVEGIIHFVGLIAFFVIFILISYQDLSRIFGG